MSFQTALMRDPKSHGKGFTFKSDANTFCFGNDESVYCINIFLHWIPQELELSKYVIEIDNEQILALLPDMEDSNVDEDPDALS
jgi:hypothetical protein